MWKSIQSPPAPTKVNVVQSCARCSTANEDRNSFCRHCGQRLSQDEPHYPGNSAPEPAGDHVDSDSTPRSRGVVVALAIVAMLLLGCVSFFVWALTPGGQTQMGEFATWAAKEATRRAG